MVGSRVVSGRPARGFAGARNGFPFLADCHSKKTACLSSMRESTRSAIISWAIVKISSVSGSIGCHSKSADCRVYNCSRCKREYTLIC